MKRIALGAIVVIAAGLGYYFFFLKNSGPEFYVSLCDNENVVRVGATYSSNESNLNGSFVFRLYGGTISETYTLASFFVFESDTMEEISFDVPSTVCERTTGIGYSIELDVAGNNVSERMADHFNQNSSLEVKNVSLELSEIFIN